MSTGQRQPLTHKVLFSNSSCYVGGAGLGKYLYIFYAYDRRWQIRHCTDADANSSILSIVFAVVTTQDSVPTCEFANPPTAKSPRDVQELNTGLTEPLCHSYNGFHVQP